MREAVPYRVVPYRVALYAVVFGGGCVGALLRFWLSQVLPQASYTGAAALWGSLWASLSWGTFAANVLACFIYALVAAFLASQVLLPRLLRDAERDDERSNGYDNKDIDEHTVARSDECGNNHGELRDELHGEVHGVSRAHRRELVSRAVNMGFCGALSTMSTFMLENFTLLRHGNALGAALYMGMSAAAGLLAAALGAALAQWLLRATSKDEVRS